MSKTVEKPEEKKTIKLETVFVFAEPKQVRLKVDQIVASEGNPRQGKISAESVKDLMDSIRQKGLLNSLLVRAVNGDEDTYELIAGHRRLKALQELEIREVDCKVYDAALQSVHMTELALVDNIQREDLSPMDEAEAFERMKIRPLLRDGKTQRTVAEIAAIVGKPASYVAQRMKLLTLTPKVRAAFAAGKIEASVAMTLARIENPEVQERAFTEISGTYNRMHPLDAVKRIVETFTLSLAKAPFDTKDPELVKKAGPCTTCPKRAGNVPDLFGDLTGNTCTDPRCYSKKKAAAVGQVIRESKEKGYQVVRGVDARCAIHDWYSGPFVKPGSVCKSDDKRRTWAALLGKDLEKLPKIHAIADGKTARVIPRAEALKLLEGKGHKWASAVRARREAADSLPEKKETPEEARKRKVDQREEELYEQAFRKAITSGVFKMKGPALARLALSSVLTMAGESEGAAQMLGWKEQAKRQYNVGPRLKMWGPKIKSLTVDQILAAMVILGLAEAVGNGDGEEWMQILEDSLPDLPTKKMRETAKAQAEKENPAPKAKKPEPQYLSEPGKKAAEAEARHKAAKKKAKKDK